MEHLTPILKARRKFIIMFALALALLSGALSLIAPLKYSATLGLLITQKSSFTLDPYTAIRSTELIGESLAQLVKTSSFLDRVLQSGSRIDPKYFVLDERRRRILWANTIEASQMRGTGILKITAYHPKSEEAMKIATAVSFLLSTQGGEYVGRDINVRLVDAPLASRFPVRPNIPLNMLAGAFLGAVLGSGWVFVQHRRKKHHGELL